MVDNENIITHNLQVIKERMARAAIKSKRTLDDITLLAVTKYVSIDMIRLALDAGVKIIGENKVQDSQKKFEAIGPRAGWHFIGHLQTNKARQAAALFDMVQTVDSFRIADALDTEAGKLDRQLNVLVQVNIGQEETKFGVSLKETQNLVDYVKEKAHLKLRGLMAMAPYTDDIELTRPYFKSLNELFQEMKIKKNVGNEWDTLSMGMTHDFEVAIEEGATLIRIGTGLFSKGSFGRIG